MRGVTHYATGLGFGAGFASLIAGHHVTDRFELARVALVVAGASYFPDVDHHSATVAQTFGAPTKALARFVEDVSGGHRGATHSIVGAAIFAGLAWLVQMLGGAAGEAIAHASHAGPGAVHLAGALGQYAAVIIALAYGVRGLGFGAEGKLATLGVFAAAAAFVVVSAAQGVTYGWVPLAVFVGCCSHLLGDALTEHGIPILWPLTWKRINLGWIDTNEWVEVLVVFPLVCAGAALAFVVQLGYWPPIEHAARVAVQAASSSLP